MNKLHWTGALALSMGLALAGWSAATAQSPSDRPAAAREQPAEQAAPALRAGDIKDRLREQGYRSIVLAGKEAPYVTAYGCAGRDDYVLTLDEAGNVVDREAVGRCGGKESVTVRAPYTDVDVKGKDVRVRAPYAAVDVDKSGVRVRAPFVDLNIPR